jgi:hypothetical protein
MPFLTKVDFSSNRQVKQYEQTFTELSGGTKFGLPFGDLTNGPDLSATGITQTLTNLVSTFSGNSATTVFSWYSPSMSLAENGLSAITPTTSAITQNTGVVFTSNTTTTIDGNLVTLTYSGVSFDLVGLAMIDLGGGNYSGSVHTNNLYFFSAGTLDFTGRTIWVDVSGITRTQDLIITDTPQVGYVWSCIDAEGKGAWSPVSGVTGATSHWSGSVGTNAIVVKNSQSLASGTNSLAEGFQTTASGNYSHAEGFQTLASAIGAHSEGEGTIASGKSAHSEGTYTIAGGDYSHAEGYLTKAIGVYSHVGGNNSIASGTTTFVHGSNSIALGNSTIILGDNITGSTNNYTFVESLNIKNVGSSSAAFDLRIDANGFLTTNTSDIRLKENIAPIKNALSVIKNLNGITYQWKDKGAGGDGLRFGFVAQDVYQVEPYLTFTNKNDGYMGLHIDGIIPFLVEAVKEIASGETIKENVYLETQKIIAEDNNIDLNYGGSKDTALNGGIKVLHGIENDVAAEFILDENGSWITNNEIAPMMLKIPYYTPSSSNDSTGKRGNITMDDSYLYVKTNNGWKRSRLEDF